MASAWRESGVVFADRADAGRQLALRLQGLDLPNPLVLALPRGGVEVASEIARTLRAPLDIIPARKLGAPIQPELAVGAIAPGALVLNDAIMREVGVARGDLGDVIAREEREMARQATLFRSGRPPLDLSGHSVIIVDDGLATGATAAAAIRSARSAGPRKVVLAVPVGARETVARLRPEVDALVCLETPPDFQAVGQWYEEFEQLTDERVIQLLAQSWRPD